jgi:hypothetical protein
VPGVHKLDQSALTPVIEPLGLTILSCCTRSEGVEDRENGNKGLIYEVILFCVFVM